MRQNICSSASANACSAHLQPITTLPTLCNNLTMISVVNGSLLTDTGINDLITYSPNLKFVSFLYASKLTNASFDIALTNFRTLRCYASEANLRLSQASRRQKALLVSSASLNLPLSRTLPGTSKCWISQIKRGSVFDYNSESLKRSIRISKEVCKVKVLQV